MEWERHGRGGMGTAYYAWIGLYSAILQTLNVPAIWVYHSTAGIGSSVPSFAINGRWREAWCLHLRYCPREVLVNSHKLGNCSEVGVIEFLRNKCWCKPSYTVLVNKAELAYRFCCLPTPCRSLRPAVLSECSNVWIFQAIFSHTPC